MARTVIRNGRIVSMDAAIGDFTGDVLVEGSRIAAVGRSLAVDDAAVVDASGMIVMPGFVNAHLHTWQTGIRGIAGDWTMMDYLRAMHAGLAPAFAPDDIYIANLIGAINQINNGVTTVFDWCHNNPTPAHTDAAIRGLDEAGIRCVFGHGSPKPDAKDGDLPFSHKPHPESEIKRLRAGRFASDGGLMTLAMCILGPHYSIWDVTKHDFELARRYDITVSCHVGGATGMIPDGFERLAAAKLLGPRLNVVHGNNLTDAILAVFADVSVNVTVTPEVEMQMGFGYPLTGRLIRLGARPSIGVDVESDIGGEMFTVMRMAMQMQRAVDNEPHAQAGKAPPKLAHGPRDALRWATLNGAHMMGLESRIGSLTPGKEADLIMIRATDLNLFPAHNPVQSVVMHAHPGNVDSVMIAGRFRKRAGRLDHPDLGRKMHTLAESGRRILGKVGLLVA
ncbi:MAG: amidohydrolase family protein [Alphaproteobacteria bacterium]|nr:amidohydrolase family protein [Alphaproteobacteria bacterium]